MEELTDQDLENLSAITEQDILTAHNEAVKALDRQYKNLLLATPDDLENADSTNA